MTRTSPPASSKSIPRARDERRIGLSIKAANYSPEQLKAEQAVVDSVKPGEDLVALQHVFDQADEANK